MTKKKHFENCRRTDGRTDGRTPDATPWHKLIGSFGPDELKTEEVVRDARFPQIFIHNMLLPWQHTFCHCPKMCLAHLHPKANICAKFHENWSKTEEEVRDARFATDRPTNRQHADSYIYPLQTLFGGPRYKNRSITNYILPGGQNHFQIIKPIIGYVHVHVPICLGVPLRPPLAGSPNFLTHN